MRSVREAVVIARDFRARLLERSELPRDLAGQCGLAALHVAAAMSDPWMLRTGCYMAADARWPTRGRYPHRHAWCQVGDVIVDATATQFKGRVRAVHVTTDHSRYVEFASGSDAINDILRNWCCAELPEYVQLARRLRCTLRRRA